MCTFGIVAQSRIVCCRFSLFSYVKVFNTHVDNDYHGVSLGRYFLIG